MDIIVHHFSSTNVSWYSFVQILKRETEWTHLNKAYVAMVLSFPGKYLNHPDIESLHYKFDTDNLSIQMHIFLDLLNSN